MKRQYILLVCLVCVILVFVLFVVLRFFVMGNTTSMDDTLPLSQNDITLLDLLDEVIPPSAKHPLEEGERYENIQYGFAFTVPQGFIGHAFEGGIPCQQNLPSLFVEDMGGAHPVVEGSVSVWVSCFPIDNVVRQEKESFLITEDGDYDWWEPVVGGLGHSVEEREGALSRGSQLVGTYEREVITSVGYTDRVLRIPLSGGAFVQIYINYGGREMIELEEEGRLDESALNQFNALVESFEFIEVRQPSLVGNDPMASRDALDRFKNNFVAMRCQQDYSNIVDDPQCHDGQQPWCNDGFGRDCYYLPDTDIPDEWQDENYLPVVFSEEERAVCVATRMVDICECQVQYEIRNTHNTLQPVSCDDFYMFIDTLSEQYGTLKTQSSGCC